MFKKQLIFLLFVVFSLSTVNSLKKVSSFSTTFQENSLTFGAIYEDDDSFQIKISKSGFDRYEVPTYVVPPPIPSNKSVFTEGLVMSNKSDPLNFQILSSKSTPVFNFTDQNFNFEEYYISFSYTLTSKLIFGNGERIHQFLLGEGIYTTWANDTGTPYDDGTGGFNLYGMHPFLLNGCSDGTWLGIFFVNSNAQDLLIGAPNTDGSVIIEQRTVGGLIDLRIIRGDTPEHVVKKYHNKIGKPLLPPYWALGWHQCRYGYDNDTILNQVVQKYAENNIPLDTIWSDINYMLKYEDFTLATKRYPNFTQLISEWHNNGVHFVPIVDLGIAAPTSFSEKAIEMNAVVISNFTEKPYINTVWPGDCVFTDFTHPNGSVFWKFGLDTLHHLMHFDGIWLDMNEPSVFSSEVGADINDDALNRYAHIPYVPGNGRIDLVTKSMSVNAKVYGNQNPEHSTIYNMKTINTYLQIKATNEFLERKNKRAFILSRSTIFGQGSIGNHWLGDNDSTFYSMKFSIPGIFNFQMFGFNLVGADICGFNGDTTDELCSRWTILGSFYPFSRNHNSDNTIPQEPYALGNLTLTAAQNAIPLRYAILRYIYTQMFINSREGGTTFRPIFFEFPNDPEAYNHIDEQFFLGSALLFSPALHLSEDWFQTYFPNANWNKFPDGASVHDYQEGATSGSIQWVNGAFDLIHIHIRGGSILPFQDEGSPMNTDQLRTVPTNLYISADQEGNASGKIIWDDGLTVGTIKSKQYIEIDYALTPKGVTLTLIQNFCYENQDILLSTIVVLRSGNFVVNNPRVYLINGNNYPIEYQTANDSYNFILPLGMKHNEISHVLFST